MCECGWFKMVVIVFCNYVVILNMIERNMNQNELCQCVLEIIVFENDSVYVVLCNKINLKLVVEVWLFEVFCDNDVLLEVLVDEWVVCGMDVLFNLIVKESKLVDWFDKLLFDFYIGQFDWQISC